MVTNKISPGESSAVTPSGSDTNPTRDSTSSAVPGAFAQRSTITTLAANANAGTTSPMPASGTAHTQWRFDNVRGPTSEGGVGTIGVGMESSGMESLSIVERALTERVGWTVGGAVLVLVVLGRVKTVRGKRPLVRRLWEKLPFVRPQIVPRLEVEYLPTVLYRRPHVWQKAFAVVGSGVLSVVMGAMLALAIGASAVWAVTTLTGRLK